MDQNLIEDAKRGGYVSEIMRRLGKAESNIRTLLSRPIQYRSNDVIGMLPQGTVPAGTTRHTAPFYNGVGAAAINFICPVDGDLRNLAVRIDTAQPATGSLVVTVLVGGAATPLVVTIPAGSPAGQYRNLADIVPISVGLSLRLTMVNNAAAASASVGSINLLLQTLTVEE